MRREGKRKAGLDRSRDRGAYAVEEEISKRISLSPLYAPSTKFGIARKAILAIKFLSARSDDPDFVQISRQLVSKYYLFISLHH